MIISFSTGKQITDRENMIINPSYQPMTVDDALWTIAEQSKIEERSCKTKSLTLWLMKNKPTRCDYMMPSLTHNVKQG